VWANGLAAAAFVSLQRKYFKNVNYYLRADFDAVAEDRYARIVASGKTIPWQEMRGYLEERLAGKSIKRPLARKLARSKCRALNKSKIFRIMDFASFVYLVQWGRLTSWTD
jgi:hypothetical protein